ncbi:glycerophosphodiester phosphodiesterase [Paenibacillus apiarius]|uniref:Glycerophosphodiester phosphodiesterase n=1 Tax=Paenibacillus apiarius TaxID=46240 RepID=A0ABT4DUI9_9BACL|nr:glycerophosphodiester phosphodiesterase family protein [Paenibacillus apiarius]MCY9514463.1 glycerophosphodiester phosphodiesterase [Paenibacillus apiarius]MCY9520999.1 glycerophosphodiester phosphodiesterase [Paenibacillus apiarius]MCY9551845.1 glycerophosphodiester phosphodiesterase [Paenibacillus apiarius]MCY9557733.1 glycerophosphodiester phosphodiesterase [Paenibacillus apiarius]MCY9684420.1 glycerophosphodiester phosphodiesterase [Paenibacillus apiarius]
MNSNALFHHVEIVAHRGYAAVHPENTMEAFRRALELGADSLEIDVHHSKEGIPVVIHDDTLDRTTDGTGPVREKTIEELQQVDAGTKFKPEFAGCRIPLLEEVLELCGGTVGLQLELKERITEGEARALLHLLTNYRMTERTMVISFHPDNLRLVRSLHHNIELGWLSDKPVDLAPLQELGRATLLLQHGAVQRQPDIVQAAEAAGIGLGVWTIRDLQDAYRLVRLGVRRLTSDIPLYRD